MSESFPYLLAQKITSFCFRLIRVNFTKLAQFWLIKIHEVGASDRSRVFIKLFINRKYVFIFFIAEHSAKIEVVFYLAHIVQLSFNIPCSLELSVIMGNYWTQHLVNNIGLRICSYFTSFYSKILKRKKFIVCIYKIIICLIRVSVEEFAEWHL